MSRYKLYWRSGSGSLIAEVALAMAGVDWDGIEVGPGTEPLSTPEFLAISPLGHLPVIVLPDGTPVPETAAIQIVMDELHPEKGLLPPVGASDRATALQWLMQFATTGYSAAIRLYYTGRYTTDPSPAALDAVRAAANAELDRLFDVYARAVKGPFLLGATMTIVDVYAVMIADWYPPAIESALFQRLRADILRHPAVSAAWDRHGYVR